MATQSETLSFVCNPELSQSGSGYLRSFQLAELAAKRLKSVRVRAISELGQGIRDEVLVFNKSCFWPQTLPLVLEALPALQRRNVCLADPLDAVVAGKTIALFDGAIASSLTQMEHLSGRSSKPVFLIHHHVDVRLPSRAKTWDRARLAYFGELSNTWHVACLNDRVDFISIDTTNAIDISWARHLPYYNMHYCLRRARDIDGFKPATKLFVAASLGTAVIVERSNEEARRLLPQDYPYFTNTVELSQVRRVIERAIAGFGQEEWGYAKAALAAIGCYRQGPILDAIEDMMQSVTCRKSIAASRGAFRAVVD